MATENELKSLFEKQLKEKLSALESTRKGILRRYFYAFLLIAAFGRRNFFSD